uniref:CHK kinase-like domain-containing protein n=1 Tax=Ditylum brightwellii TaxID=49249 RepID=A0A7S1Z7D1_9STRA|mmetsp:Transcript_25999/g.38672  ORF Transcript_25999/g.38672 Transcript_25999/m.38672 type:complete len:388 (+) Transcript_25999:196-1359(+)
MFQIEASFYKMQQQQSSSSSTTTTTTTTLPPLPFHLAKMIYSSSHCIILEKIEHVQSFPLVHGCPTLSIRECMIRNLALMHARYWQTTAATTTTTTAYMQTFWKSLSSTPGIGSSLSGKDKEYLFPTHWNDFLRSTTNISETERNKIQNVCINLQNKQIHQIHDKVHVFQTTLIHGDYHIANVLFSPQQQPEQKENQTEKKKFDSSFWLLDWATCGLGNPLLDVVFFLLVSTNAPLQEGEVKHLLQYYYSILTSNDSTHTKSNPHGPYIASTFSYDTFMTHYQHALLNQFIVLVCYDKLSRQLIDSLMTTTTTTTTTLTSSNADEKKTKQDTMKKHFDNVNERCIRALLSNEMNLDCYDMPHDKTEVDRMEEEERRHREGDGVVRDI